MTTSLSRILRFALLTGALAVRPALPAEEPSPATGTGASSEEVAKAAEQTAGPAVETPPAPVVYDALTDETLQQVLLGMGHVPKKLSKGFLIAVKRDTWTINMQLVLSPDGTKLGFNANCGLVDEDTVTAAQWMALLVANEDVDPSSFYYDAKQKKLYLHRSLDNRAITAVFLRVQIERFCDNVVKTGDLWKFTK